MLASIIFGFLLAQSISKLEIQGLTEDSSVLKGKVTVVTFLSARCPISNAYGERIEGIYHDYSSKGVRFLFVNSNANETDAEVSENAKAHGFSFSIYHDRQSKAAENFQAQATPEIFLLDAGAEVRYHGAIDDAQNPARVKRNSLRDALDAVLKGEMPTVKETKAFGCTIKRPRK